MTGIPEMMNTMTSCSVSACGGNAKFAASLAENLAKAPAVEPVHIETARGGRGR